MKKHFKYLKYLVKHKFYVFVAGRKLGVGFWQLLIHDWSKFLPREWFPYANYFYGKNKKEIDFKYAWLHHQQANPHHWQYWILVNDSGSTETLQMPVKYRLEMLADWAGAGRAITGKWDVKEWYNRNKNNMQIHAVTRALVEEKLEEVFK